MKQQRFDSNGNFERDFGKISLVFIAKQDLVPNWTPLLLFMTKSAMIGPEKIQRDHKRIFDKMLKISTNLKFIAACDTSIRKTNTFYGWLVGDVILRVEPHFVPFFCPLFIESNQNL